jgi:hypothetical protein
MGGQNARPWRSPSERLRRACLALQRKVPGRPTAPVRLRGEPAVSRANKMRHIVLDVRIEACEASTCGLALPEFHLVHL